MTAFVGQVKAIVGGVTAKKTNKAVCNLMSIKIVLNDMQNPNEYIYINQTPLKRDSVAFRDLYNAAQECLSVLQLMYDEGNGNVDDSLRQASNTSSVTDELSKFYDLMKQGIITEEEFQAKKTQLLNK